MKQFFRKVHRWLGLLMALQIVAWMASGLWFSIFPIEEIRGEHLTHPSQQLELDRFDGVSAPLAIQQALDRHFDGAWTLSTVALSRIDGNLYWQVSGEHSGDPFRRLVDGNSTELVPMLTAEGAGRLAASLLLAPADPLAVEWVDGTETDSEIRGRPLPLWKVSFRQPESLSLYLDPWTREIVARRTSRWRVFDFFWMLHVMDFETREDFNHPLLQVAATLGLVIALSGVFLWVVSTRVFRRGRRTRPGIDSRGGPELV